MPRELSAYHRQVAANNRTTILEAATDLFLEFGYDRTSLTRVADRAGVSRATLFKQFPTKAELFEATVLAAGDTSHSEPLEPPSGDFLAGLVGLGMAYAELLSRPRTADLIRAVIAESARFPELRQRTFDFGTLPRAQGSQALLSDGERSGNRACERLRRRSGAVPRHDRHCRVLAPPRSRQLVGHR